MSTSDRIPVFFRCDAYYEIGMGHLMRCLSFAKSLNHKEIAFILSDRSVDFHDLIINQGLKVINVSAFLSEDAELEYLIKEIPANSIFILDGYTFSSSYLSAISNAFTTVYIDDLHNKVIKTHFILNHAIGIMPSQYINQTPRSAVLKLGTRYALVNPAFHYQEKLFNRNLVIIYGGSDLTNDTLKTLEHIVFEDYVQINVILGRKYSHYEELLKFVRNKDTGGQVSIHRNLSQSKVAEIFHKCSICICSASSVSYEYLMSGGILFINQTAKNQSHLYKHLIGLGFALSLDKVDKVNQYVSEAFFSKQLRKQALTFPKSNSSLNKLYKQCVEYNHMELEFATMCHVDIYFDWANEQEVRMNSLNSETIKYEDHVKWFTDKVADTNAIMYLVKMKNEAIGQVRFDREEDRVFRINYSIAKGFRGKGLASLLLLKTIRKMQKDHGSFHLRATVKKDNIPSQKVFINLAFDFVEKGYFEYEKEIA